MSSVQEIILSVLKILMSLLCCSPIIRLARTVVVVEYIEKPSSLQGYVINKNYMHDG